MSTSCNIFGDQAEDFLSSLAESFSVKYATNNNEYCFDVPENLGSGYFRSLQFSHGVSVLEFNVLLKKSFIIRFDKESTNPLYLLFNSDAPITHISEVEDSDTTISKLQRIMFSSGVSSTHAIKLGKSDPVGAFIIIINRKLFEEKIDAFSENLSEDLALIFKDLNGVNHVFNKDHFSLETSRVIEEFKTCELDEFMKPVFLEGKTYEILTSQIQSYSDHLQGKKVDSLLRKATIEKIESAVDIIKKELDVRINVHKLAKRVGLNQNTLQSGFKTLFKTSVNEYIKNHRLEFAKNLLENSDLNITEITYKIGINSRSYFSKLFKERYGISPKDYVKQRRRKRTA